MLIGQKELHLDITKTMKSTEGKLFCIFNTFSQVES